MKTLEQNRAAVSEWQRKNPDKVAAKAARWRAAHPDKVAAQAAKLKAAYVPHPRPVPEGTWKSRNPDKVRAEAARYRERHKDEIAARLRLARQRQRQLRREWISLHGPCRECGGSERLEVDHIDPTTKIDSEVWDWAPERRDAELAKCQVLCKACNTKKSNRPLSTARATSVSEV